MQQSCLGKPNPLLLEIKPNLTEIGVEWTVNYCYHLLHKVIEHNFRKLFADLLIVLYGFEWYMRCLSIDHAAVSP